MTFSAAMTRAEGHDLVTVGVCESSIIILTKELKPIVTNFGAQSSWR